MTILVTGASGHLGSQVVELLLKSYQGKIIAGSRSIEKLEHFKKRGVELRRVDFDDPSTTDAAFKGVDKLLIVSTDALAVPGLRLKQHLNAVASAKKNYVKHLVYTSLTNTESSPISFAPDHAGSEAAVKNSGASWTILRNNWYFENLAAAVAEAKQSGSLMTTTGKGKVGFIARADCARAAAAILISDNYKNITLDITGPQSFSYEEIAQALKVKPVAISEADLITGLKSHDLPGFVIDLFVTYEKAVSLNKMDVTNNLVEELTGQRPEGLIDYLKTL